jgi:hypothetical protein
MKKEIKKAELIQDFNLQMKFPNHKKLNTVYHFEKYGRTQAKPDFSKGVSTEIVLPQIEGECEDWILQLLLCGVGIYSNYLQSLSRNYLAKVSQLAEQGSIVYLVTDRSLCFGTNFPISNVILLDSLADSLSLNEIFQLIGRAGRVGQSWMARAFLEDHSIARLREYIRRDGQGGQEEAAVFEAVAAKVQTFDFDALDKKILRHDRLFRGYE